MMYEGYEMYPKCDDCGGPIGRILIGGTKDKKLHEQLGEFVKRAIGYCKDCMDNH